MPKRSIRNHVVKNPFLDFFDNACEILFRLISFLFLLLFATCLVLLLFSFPFDVLFSQL